MSPTLTALVDVALIAVVCVWLFSATRGIVRLYKSDRGATRDVVIAMGAWVLVGGCSWFAYALIGEQILSVPNSFELPAGYVSGVRTMADGDHVVPLQAESRVQIYDANWRFLRGWEVYGEGPMTLECFPDGTFVVYQDKPPFQYTYAEDGELISRAPFYEELNPLPSQGPYVEVPTSGVGWLLSSPTASYGMLILGSIGLALVRIYGKSKNDSPDSPSATEKYSGGAPSMRAD
jgi:hypothetical protein